MLTLNYMAIVTATIASFALGWIWYSPMLFSKLYMKEAKMKEADMKHGNMGFLFLQNFLVTLVMAYVLAHFVDYAGASDWQGGAVSGFWIWLGFVATISYGRVIWAHESLTMFALNAGFHLVELLMMGAIIAGWAW